jgi:TRAP-type transport system periplasmic protein
MNMVRITAHSWARMLALSAIAVVLPAACTTVSSTADKAGGSGEPVVLRLADTSAHIEYTPAVRYFVDRVHELSGGHLQVEVIERWGDFASDAERQVVQAVSAGRVDLAWVGARGLDTMGVHSFEALQAPMLIDSYALEDAVIRSDVPPGMLPGLNPLGVAGLAVLADGLRKPVGVKKPLVALGDLRGIGFGTLASLGQAEAIRSIGATPVQVFGPAREQAIATGTIEGFEMNLLAYQLSDMERFAPYVTANANLWPQVDVLMANPRRLAALSEQQQSWVRQAAADARVRSAELADHDAENLVLACKGGARFQNASVAELAALRQAFAPAYLTLERDPQTAASIKVIQELKGSMAAAQPLPIPEDCTGQAPPPPTQGPGTPPTSLNGTYRFTITRQDALDSPTESKSPSHLATFPWIFTATLKDGRWTMAHTGGDVETDSPGDSYSLQGDTIAFNWTGVGVLRFTYSLDNKGNLTLRSVPPMDPGNVFVWTTHTWTRIAG